MLILTENIQVVFTDDRHQLIFNNLFRFHVVFLIYSFRTVDLKQKAYYSMQFPTAFEFEKLELNRTLLRSSAEELYCPIFTQLKVCFHWEEFVLCTFLELLTP